MMRRNLIAAALSALMITGTGVATSAHSVGGCPRAVVRTHNANNSRIVITGPAIVEVWYPDAAQNGKPSWGNALRVNYVPAGIKATYFDAKGKTYNYVNNGACRHMSKHDYAKSPYTKVSRTTLKSQRVASF